MSDPASSFLLRAPVIFDGRRLRTGCAVLVRDGRIADLPDAGAPVPPGLAEITLTSGMLVPGFVDLQVNGGGGALLGQGLAAEAIATICATHARLGATTVLPTLITAAREVQAEVIAAGILAARARLPGFGGLHLEGPHLDPARAGAHDPALIRPMEDADLQALLSAAQQLPRLLVTLSPGAVSPAQIKALSEAGVIVSLGHSACSAAQARAAFAAGARGATHLFNAMGGLHHRDPGLAAAALGGKSVYSGLIADGHHVAPEMIALAFAARRGLAARAATGLFLVSDAMAVAGTAQVAFRLNGRDVQRKGGRLTLADGTLAGADYTLAQGVARLVEDVRLPLSQALCAATSTPARALDLRRAGRIAVGAAADIVHLDDRLLLQAVWQRGRQLRPLVAG